MNQAYKLLGFLTILVFAGMVIHSCSFDNPLTFPTVATEEPEPDRANSSALLRGRISNLGGDGGVIEEYGFVWSDSNNDPQVGSGTVVSINTAISQDGPFETNITGLSILQDQYFCRAYIRFRGQVVYANEVEEFNLKSFIVKIEDAPEIKNDSATVIGILTFTESGVEIDDHGTVFSSTNQNPELGGSDVDSISLGPTNDDGIFRTVIPELQFVTSYYARSFAIQNNEVVYSPVIQFDIADGWKELSRNSGNGFRAGIGVATSSMAFVGLGCTDVCGANARKFWSFDPAGTDSTTYAEQMELPAMGRQGGVTFAFGDKFYFGLGSLPNDFGGTDYPREFYAYENGAWTSDVPIFPGSGRDGAVAFIVDDRAYVGLGLSDGNELTDVWEFLPDGGPDEKGEWRSVNDFTGTPRTDAVAFVIGDKAYIGGGKAGVDSLFNDIYEFFPLNTNDPWCKVSTDLPGVARRGSVSFTIDNRVFFGAGQQIGEVYLNDIWELTSSGSCFAGDWNATWKEVSSIPLARSQAVAFSINGKGYVGSGIDIDNVGLPDFWEYTPNK